MTNDHPERYTDGVMPLEKLQKPGFVYIAYRRNNIGDFSIFKSAIEASIKDGQNLQDIIIDLTKYPVLTDGEAGLLTKAIQRLQGTSRHIRIIAGNRVKEKLESINAQAIKTAVIYPSHEQFLEAFNKI